MPENPFSVQGLDDNAVTSSREKFGSNVMDNNHDTTLLDGIKGVVLEPMFILLIISAGVYQLLGETTEALYMLGAIFLVSAISFYQDTRSRKALLALKEITAPKAKVIRNNSIFEIHSSEVVIGDYLVAEEGTLIPADGRIIQSNDFSVNESTLTGESFTIDKDAGSEDNNVYQGTLVTGGLAVFEVTAIGHNTQLAKIQERLVSIKEEKTPLQKQVRQFVKHMSLIGGLAFVAIWFVSFALFGDFYQSLLKALTLAMSILPEEIPVAFTTFMALGAWRLMKKGIIVKDTKTVEALGVATVICLDKTGTITENKMELARIYIPGEESAFAAEQWIAHPKTFEPIKYAMWASEPVPFDPMEKAIHEAYQKVTTSDERPDYQMLKEYPLSGKPPIMTHIFQSQTGQRVIAAKGAPEAILGLSNLNDAEEKKAIAEVEVLARQGFRVLAVARSLFEGDDFPEDQHEFPFVFVGLVAFYDPPKLNIPKVFERFYKAGITIKMITGDNTLTATAIGKQAGLKGYDSYIDGAQLAKMSDAELEQQVEKVNLFTRMYPEAKLRIIEALKRRNHIVAMTGDGVNDAPALKAATIGIAMGQRGSEVARQASSLVLLDDDLEQMLNATAMGRRIYSNLKKAIQYIISIHIPIILTVTLPLLLGWQFPIIFSPVHIIFFELIMGPTCSIVYENEPMEVNVMQRPPRKISKTFFSGPELSVSIVQGLAITLGSLLVYQYASNTTSDFSVVCTMVFITLCTANVFLTLVNRSFSRSILKTIIQPNKLMIGILLLSVVLVTLLVKVPSLQRVFNFTDLSASQTAIALVAGFCSVVWFDLYKFLRPRSLS